MGPRTYSPSWPTVYTKPMRFLALALTLLAPVRAWADAPEAGATVDAFRQRVVEVAETAADPAATPAAVWEKGQAFFSNVPRTTIRVEGNFRKWDTGREHVGDGAEASLQDLITGGAEAVNDLDLPAPPPPEMRDAVAASAAGYDAGRVRYSDALASGQMGLFRYRAGSGLPGMTDINEYLGRIAAIVGRRFAYATFIHEHDHERVHAAGNLSPDRVIEGEITAFQAQYEWLRYIDPREDGERLAYASERVANLIRMSRSGAARLPLQLLLDSQLYLDHLHKVRATRGDRQRIIELINELGYREGHHHHGDGHDHGPAEPAPAPAAGITRA